MKNHTNPEEIPFFWRWIYPILLTILWGGIIGILIIAFQESSASFIEKLFGGFIAGAIIALALFIMYETPFNKVIQLIARIPYAGLLFIFPWLLYWLFVWPIGLIDKLIGLIIDLHYRATLTNKSWR